MIYPHPTPQREEPIPHDPRNEPIPEEEDGGASPEEAEKKARKEEGVGMKGSAARLPTGAGTNAKLKKSASTEDEYGLPTGIRGNKQNVRSRKA